MNKEQEAQQRVEQRLREAAPPVPESERSVWPAVQERLRPRSHMRPFLWAGAATACAALCVTGFMQHGQQPAQVTPIPLPAQVYVTTNAAPAPIRKRVHHVPHVHKEMLAVRVARPHPSHISYRRSVEPSSPLQSTPPDKAEDAPRLRPASAAPRPASVKPVE